MTEQRVNYYDGLKEISIRLISEYRLIVDWIDEIMHAANKLVPDVKNLNFLDAYQLKQGESTGMYVPRTRSMVQYTHKDSLEEMLTHLNDHHRDPNILIIYLEPLDVICCYHVDDKDVGTVIVTKVKDEHYQKVMLRLKM